MADKNIYTVVVADDEDELREAVCTMIPWEALGFHLVGNASNGLDALELVERLEPDLLRGVRPAADRHPYAVHLGH